MLLRKKTVIDYNEVFNNAQKEVIDYNEVFKMLRKTS